MHLKTTLITPSGTPASLNTSIIICARTLGYHLVSILQRYPSWQHLLQDAIAVKLNGVIAYTNPSRGLYLSKRFHIIDEG
jgi:hypothetical protein